MVVLGGTSLLGGRGTFIGTLMGAGLSVQVLNATVFLSLDQKWQYIFQGFLIVAAALIYSLVRRGGQALRLAGKLSRDGHPTSPSMPVMTRKPTTAKVSQAPQSVLGPRLRAIRLRRGISLRELARRLELSPSSISQIETGKMQPSVRTLYAFVAEFGVTVDEVLFDQAQLPPDEASGAVSESSPAVAGPGLEVQRAVGRPTITLNSGVTWERLMFWADEDIEFIEATYPPGGASDEALGRHSGHEFGTVLSGVLRVVVGFDEFVLEPGDSITFPSPTPHRLSNEGSETVRAIWVVRGRRGAHPGHEAS